MTRINKELMKGSSEVLVLAVLSNEPLYGYEIAKRIKKRSSDVFDMGEGTLYPVLHKLEESGLLESSWQEMDGRKRKYYQLTRAGKKLLREKNEEWNTFRTAVESVIS
ncbi:MAG: PadR family transcriptional regulator [Candidatus Kerfeldbacteria bacterium]|nr:PadR family transcriptional regulator [Candidatus Kerfeldbacteria bacterium]